MADDLQCPVSPSSSKTSSKDSIFEPTVDMMVNDFDDERTLEEEEAMAAQEQDDPTAELSSLQKESDMPLEELLALYKIPVESMKPSRGSSKRGKKRRKVSSSNNEKLDGDADEPASSKRDRRKSTSKESTSDKGEKDDSNKELKIKISCKPSTSTADLENDCEEADSCEENENILDIEDDESEYEEEDDDLKEESHLKKLYPETYQAVDKRLLRTLSRQQSDEEDDGDYSPDEDEMRKSIMIGSEYQAVIPEGFSQYDDALPYENEDKLLWDPNRVNEEQIVEFLTKAHEQTKPLPNCSGNIPAETNVNFPQGSGNLRDDEQALFLLLQCGYNVDEALRRKRINPLPATDQMSIWSEEECRNFESVIRLYGKDFHTIKHAKVHTRSVGELVQFYYLWKKTERHDVFANKARLDKKKYNGLTDYMDKFLEELDTANNQNCNSSSSSSAAIDRSSSPSSTSVTGMANGVTGSGAINKSNQNQIESNTNNTETEIIIPPQDDK